MIVEQKKLGWFKRQCFKLDTHVMKPFLVYKYTTENVEAMNEIDAFMDEQVNWQEDMEWEEELS